MKRPTTRCCLESIHTAFMAGCARLAALVVLAALMACGGLTPARPGPVDCNRADEFGPARVSAQDYAARHGAATRKLSELESSVSQPVEVCGVAGQLDFLMAAQCADGSSPFTQRTEAHSSRSGNVGAGGRCDGIIDLYEVPCPEATYPVYIDMYFCRAGQSWQ